tara:strand:- start:218 stop:478 length:261 start_codon:yes stop_codon:yes gene_type:complete
MQFKINKNQEVIISNDLVEMNIESLNNDVTYDESDIVYIDKNVKADAKNILRNKDLIIFRDKVKKYVMCFFENITASNQSSYLSVA